MSRITDTEKEDLAEVLIDRIDQLYEETRTHLYNIDFEKFNLLEFIRGLLSQIDSMNYEIGPSIRSAGMSAELESSHRAFLRNAIKTYSLLEDIRIKYEDLKTDKLNVLNDFHDDDIVGTEEYEKTVAEMLTAGGNL